MATYVLRPQRGSQLDLAVKANAAAASVPEVQTDTRNRLVEAYARGTRGMSLREWSDAVDEPLATSRGLARAGRAMPEAEMAPSAEHSREVRSNENIRVLDGLGALIVNVDSGDLAALQAAGFEATENFAIPLEEPTARAPVAEAPNGYWHKQKTQVSLLHAAGIRGQGMRAGIIDTGIDATHPEFAGRKIDFMEFDTQGFKLSRTPRDAGDHGTHVSGIIAGANTGMAPEASISMAAALTTRQPDGQMVGYFAQIAAALDWVLFSDFGTDDIDDVDVVNASLGGLGFRDYLYNSLDVNRAGPTKCLVASIGNAGPNKDTDGSPGNYDIVVGVGATDEADQIANFSSWGNSGPGPKPDLCAPGVDIISAKPGGGYQKMSGTSMAAPCVTGAALLLLQKFPSLRRAKATQIAGRLGRLTVPIMPRERAGFGRLDLSGM